MTLAPTAAPVRPFLDFRVATDPAHWSAELALLGVLQSEPYSGDPFPNDQSRAPDAIRWQSKRFCYALENWDFDLGFDLASALPARRLDLGNAAWSGGDYDDYAAAVTARVRHLWRQGAQVVVLGGDHGVTIPVLEALDAVGEPVHVLQIDAHIDWREEREGEPMGFSSTMRRASEMSHVWRIVQAGARGIGSARQGEVDAAIGWGARIVPGTVFHREGIDSVLRHIEPESTCVISLDLDVLDSSVMPAVAYPSPGGMTFLQLTSLIAGIAAKARIGGFAMVEFVAKKDLTGTAALTAGRVAMHVLHHVARQTKK
jgi:agmatinase